MKTRPELLVQLERIREMGYAINDQETESDLRAVGVALHVIGAPVAAIAVAAPAARMDIELARKYGERLRQRLAELEGSLGHTRGPG
jgi:IclR family acetate operon transcriptional repressor